MASFDAVDAYCVRKTIRTAPIFKGVSIKNGGGLGSTIQQLLPVSRIGTGVDTDIAFMAVEFLEWIVQRFESNIGVLSMAQCRDCLPVYPMSSSDGYRLECLTGRS